MKNTPITKRVHMSAYKKNSPAKQTTDPVRVTGAAGEVLEAKANITKGESGRLPTYKEAWEQNLEGIRDKYKDFASYVADMKSIKKGDKRDQQREEARAKAVERGRKPSVTFNYKPINQDPTKGTTVDTSDAYGVRQISRGQKKATRDVRRAKIKLGKLAKQDGQGNWVPNKNLSPRQKAKFEERLQELKGMKDTQTRIMSQAKAGVDPTITSRFNFGTEMKKGTPGGPLIDTTGKYQTKENFERTTKEKYGITPETTKVSFGFNTEPPSNAERFLGKDYSAPFAKKSASSMLKKKGCKMGGYGSKTYKK